MRNPGLHVHRSGDCGYRRGYPARPASANPRAGAHPVMVKGLRPPPGRRTRPSGVSFLRSSASPRPLVLRARPVARITALTPPPPAAIASAAPNGRRPLSSNDAAALAQDPQTGKHLLPWRAHLFQRAQGWPRKGRARGNVGATANLDSSILRVGAEKRDSRSNKETDQENKKERSPL
jgi:hypothetical protein